ncbi:MAG: hypothetical protein EOO36_02705 [Cytophagaceae bacterium]|nr:MAG: hypothetical protein EOO36_02705 [Cytophagaceae bacterium]
MQPATRRLASTAILLYIAAYLLTIVLHELGHAVMALALGDHPILYNTSVQNTNKQLSNGAHVLIAAAGPLLSLLQGTALLVLLRRGRAVGASALFWLYMSVFGLINFFGYLMIAPLVPGGDTGQIVARLHVPAPAQWAVAVGSLGCLVLLIGSTAPLFLRQLPATTQATPLLRTSGMRALLLWPWLVGSVVLVLLALPAPHPAVVANMFMSPMVLRRAYRRALAGPAVETPATEPLGAPWALAGAVLLLAVGFKLLGRGIAW